MLLGKDTHTGSQGWKISGWFLVMMLWMTTAHSQTSPERYVVDHWTTEDGLPVNSINEVIQSQNGYLWMATFDGLVRFDGMRFKIFNSAGYPGLPSNRILDITEAPDGSLWLETEQSFLVRYQNGVFTHIGPEDGYNGTLVHTLNADSAGTIWMGSEKGISIYRNGTLSAFEPERIKGVIDRLYLQKNGAVWYRDHQNKTVYRFFGDTLTALTRTRTAYDMVPFVETEDAIWLGTGHGLYRFANNKLSLASGYFTGDTESYYLSKTPGGRLQVATKADGLYEYEKGVPSSLITDAEFLTAPFYSGEKGDRRIISAHRIFYKGELVYHSRPAITDYLFDREGNLWLATFNDGLYRLKPNPFTIYSEAEGLPDRNVYPVMEAQDGSIWVGTHGRGAARIKNGKAEAGYLPVGNEGAAYVRTLRQRRDGTILMGLSGAGIWRLEGHSFYQYPSPQTLATATVASIFEDSKDRLWIGSARGLFLQSNETWTLFDIDRGFPYHIVRFITEAPDGSLWMATNGGGIVHFFDEQFRIYTGNDGLSGNLVRALHIEPSGESGTYLLWIGSEGHGLSRLQVRNTTPDFSGITHYRKRNGLFDNGIHRILDDGQGFFWMSSNRGIFRVAKAELEAFHRGETEQIHSVGYTEKDGLLNREANGGIQPAGIRASDGRLWFPTQDGVVVVDPGNIQSNKTPPPVVIETVTADDRSVWNGKETFLELELGRRDFEITYTALSLLVPEKNQFRYKLEGFDEQWRNADNRRTAFYTNVPPGDYTFRVIASNNNGVWNETGAALHIAVIPFFYETTWFYGLCGAAIILLIFLGIRMRTRHLAEAERRLTTLVEERTHELRLEKKKTEEQAEELKKLDETKSRFFANISHEFRTPLTLIMNPLKQLLSGTLGIFSDAVSKRHQLMLRNSYRLLRLIDQLLDLSRLEEGRARLNIKEVELIAFTENICELFELTAKERKLTLNVHDNGSRQLSEVWVDRDKMEKVIANLLSNAIKYTEPGGAIDIRFRETASTCEIIVCDTGVGIGKAQQRHIFDRFYQVDSGDTRRSEGVGVGLALVKEFVELHGGEIAMESEEGEGTCFTVTLKKGRTHFSDKDLEVSDAAGSSFDEGGFDKPVEEDPVSASLEEQAVNTAVFETDEISADADVTSVLVAEDHADLRAFLCEMLSKTYRVFEAGDGQTALELIREKLPDLIVADIMMPGMDGRTLNRELKKDSSLASIPLIFLTAKAASEEKIKGFAEGADDYLTKPFDAEVLLARIDNLIESRMRLRKLILEETNGQEPFPEEVEDPFLLKLNGALEHTFGNPGLSITSLAGQLHVDRTHLYRKLKSKTDLTPQQYILQFRLKKAAMLFREQRGSVSEVAYAVGFNSLSWFARQFREQFGMNPSEYLAEIKA